MNTEIASLASFEEQRAKAQDLNALIQMAPAQVIELVTVVADGLCTLGLEAEAQHNYIHAALLYDEIVAIFQNAIVILPDTVQADFAVLVDYWQERSQAARSNNDQNASADAPTTLSPNHVIVNSEPTWYVRTRQKAWKSGPAKERNASFRKRSQLRRDQLR